ncbi:SRPBCC family protein [Aliiroseovarius sp.]|uniref:SRPBCC family protein n=1 Tax=Aliiroseovarius sp. TaxID=1872442 RepID=UPI003BAC00F7
MTELSVEITRHIPHPPERVFDAWLDPAMLSRFMIPGAGVTVPEVTNDPTVGGRFRIIMRVPDAGDLPHEGEYRVIDRANRLQFTWVSPASTSENSLVTLDLSPNGTGTDLLLHHQRFPSQDSRDNHEAGWGAILATLDEVLA